MKVIRPSRETIKQQVRAVLTERAREWEGRKRLFAVADDFTISATYVMPGGSRNGQGITIKGRADLADLQKTLAAFAERCRERTLKQRDKDGTTFPAAGPTNPAEQQSLTVVARGEN